MTVKQRVTLLFVLMNLIVCRAQYELKLNARKPTRKLTKLLKLNGSEDYPFQHNNKCGDLPPTLLTDVLGAAFNSRYMSIEEPKHWEDDDDTADNHHPKRDSALVQPFYVDDTYALEISDKPAWEVKHVTEMHYENGSSIDSVDRDVESNRSKRDARRGTTSMTDDSGRGRRDMRNDRPWNCEAKIKWIDLGPDYFPRFLRSVECTKKKCWYNHYVCKPRSFTVKLLRRRNGECVQTNKLNRITNKELPGELKELWVWEERAVNFCCDCAFP